MDIMNPSGILRCQGCGRGHGVTAMSGQDLLVGFEPTASNQSVSMLRPETFTQCNRGIQISCLQDRNFRQGELERGKTHAPPEESDPAMTSTRGGALISIFVDPRSVQFSQHKHRSEIGSLGLWAYSSAGMD